MEKAKTNNSPFTKVDHIGVTVRDVEKAVRYYQALGIGPFEPVKTDVITDRKVRGKPTGSGVWFKAQVAKMGEVKLELVEPIAGETYQTEFLQTKGEGISHLAFVVNDIDKAVAKLTKMGLAVLYSAKFLPSGGCAHVETKEVGGFNIELIQYPPE